MLSGKCPRSTAVSAVRFAARVFGDREEKYGGYGGGVDASIFKLAVTGLVKMAGGAVQSFARLDVQRGVVMGR